MLLPRRWVLLLAFIFSFLLFFSVFSYRYQIHNAISYVSRPLWDHPDGPTKFTTHYYTEGLPFDEATCKLHGWDIRRSQPRVWDAVLFSSELDLFEIRLHELDGVVDKFFVVESNRTFTGNPKPLYFAENRDRFLSFAHKLIYRELVLDHFDTDPWKVEAAHRDALTNMINTELSSSPGQPLVIMADVDEIPSAHTLRLVQTCDAPSPLHLQLHNYVYSFEWPLGLNSWRAQVHKWVSGQSYYKHSKSTELALADSGWHCSFCFRTLNEFVLKMKGYSHSDRIGGDMSLLSLDRIQKVICEGKDIFNMLPEAYSFKDLLAWMTPEPSKSVTGIPLYILQNPEKFKFLLPGGCVRES